MNARNIIYESILDDLTANDQQSAVTQIKNSYTDKPRILNVYDKAIVIKFEGMSKLMKDKEKFYQSLQYFDELLNEVLNVMRVVKSHSVPVYRLVRGVLGISERYDNYIEQNGLWFEHQPNAFDDSYESKNSFDVMIGVVIRLKRIEKLPEFIKQLNGIGVGLVQKAFGTGTVGYLHFYDLYEDYHLDLQRGSIDDIINGIEQTSVVKYLRKLQKFFFEKTNQDVINDYFKKGSSYSQEIMYIVRAANLRMKDVEVERSDAGLHITVLEGKEIYITKQLVEYYKKAAQIFRNRGQKLLITVKGAIKTAIWSTGDSATIDELDGILDYDIGTYKIYFHTAFKYPIIFSGFNIKNVIINIDSFIKQKKNEWNPRISFVPEPGNIKIIDKRDE